MIRRLFLSAAALALVCGPAAAQSRNSARASTDIAPGTHASPSWIAGRPRSVTKQRIP